MCIRSFERGRVTGSKDKRVKSVESASPRHLIMPCLQVSNVLHVKHVVEGKPLAQQHVQRGHRHEVSSRTAARVPHICVDEDGLHMSKGRAKGLERLQHIYVCIVCV